MINGLPFFLEYQNHYCGCGGEALGIKRAQYNGLPICKMKLGINHNPIAIKTHDYHYPESQHVLEDIRKVILNNLCQYSPEALKSIWASLECKTFSIARGVSAIDLKSRLLAWELLRYARHFMPDYIQIENVPQFKNWGPLRFVVAKRHETHTELKVDKKGRLVMKAIKERKGEYYHKWIRAMKALGYEYDYRELVAADYGAPTIRKRYFGIFAKKGLPIAFPEATHSKVPDLRNLKPWVPVKTVLDLDDHGDSIFEKQYCTNTMKRLFLGCVKNIAGLSEKQYMTYYYGTGTNSSSLDAPAGTVRTKTCHHLVSPQFINEQYGQSKGRSLFEPSGSLATNPKQELVSTQYLEQMYGSSDGVSIDQPSWAVATNPKQRLVTVVKGKTKHFLYDPNWYNTGRGIDKPGPTIVASMDKVPPGLITLIEGHPAIVVKPTDCEWTVKLKEFMAIYGILDIKKRRLKIKELLQIQGFPPDYKLFGTETQQLEQIGNAVVPVMSKVWAEALYKANLERYYEQLKQTA